MSTAAEAPVARASRRTSAWVVAWSLALVEGRRLLRHPLTVAGVVLGTTLLVLVTWVQAPVLNRHDSLTTEALLPVAGGALIGAHLATLRARRHHTVELHDATPTSEATVTVAQLLAVALLGAASLGVALMHLAYLKVIGGIASPRSLVVLTGPAVVVFGGTVGVAVARRAPWVAAGPLALAALVGLSIVLMTRCSLDIACGRAYFAPVILSEAWNSAPSELSYRPTGAHLAYVAGLAVTAATVALLRYRPRAAMALLGALGMGLAGVGGYAKTRPVPEQARRGAAAFLLAPKVTRSCAEHASVRYCAYPDYAAWIDEWRAPVAGVAAAVPPGARPRDLAVVQRPRSSDLYAENALFPSARYSRMRRRAEHKALNEIAPGLQWARHDLEADFELVLALEVARRVTGIESRFRLAEGDRRALAELIGRRKRIGRLGSRVNYCMALDQGRAIVALWLAAQATPKTEAAFHRAIDEFGYGTPGSSLELYSLSFYTYDVLGDDDQVSWGNRDAHYAARLLERPKTEVRGLISAHWERLVDPATGGDEAAALLGLARLPSLEEASRGKLARVVYSPLCR